MELSGWRVSVTLGSPSFSALLSRWNSPHYSAQRYAGAGRQACSDSRRDGAWRVLAGLCGSTSWR